MIRKALSSISHQDIITSPLIVALDYSEIRPALALADKISPHRFRLKIGKEMFTRFGPDLIRNLQRKGFDVFLDLKFHDIPNTVARAVTAAADLGVWMLNIHAIGGERMILAACEALQTFGSEAPLLVAVTMLTSMSDDDLRSISVPFSYSDYSYRLARLSRNCGVDGIVCSAQEALKIKTDLGQNFLVITPGVRPGTIIDGDDQQRIMTPIQAQEARADYIVIGRPVTMAEDPAAALEEILQSLYSAKIICNIKNKQ